VFITIDGIDATGKTTIAQQLYKHLKNQNDNVVLLRDPGTTVLAEKIRDILKTTHTSAMEQLYLFLAAKASLTHEIIQYLEKGYTVISDRYIDSTFVYQGMLNNISPLTIQKLGQYAYIPPDITFITKCNSSNILQRLLHRNDSDLIEKSLNQNKIEHMIQCFERLPEIFPKRLYYFIDTNVSIEESLKQVISYLHSFN
jgi:dTMP kinase